jgi:hypothetical protein
MRKERKRERRIKRKLEWKKVRAEDIGEEEEEVGKEKRGDEMEELL